MDPQQNAGGGQSAPVQPSPQNNAASPFAPPAMPVGQNTEAVKRDETKTDDPFSVLKLPSNVAITDNAAPTTAPQSGGLGVDDGDLIEKEWVDKAKQIVDHYREDPFMQSKQMTIFRADYMKKRYNRTIKLGE